MAERTSELEQTIRAMLAASEPPVKTRLLLDDERAVLKAALEQLQALRDRHAALEIHAAELHEAAEEFLIATGTEGDDLSWGRANRAEQQLRTALRTPPPAAGQAILAEVTRLRKVRDALRKVGDRPYDTEAAAGLESALEELDALDQAAP